PPDDKPNDKTRTKLAAMSEVADLKAKYVLQTAGFDARFPNQNQTKHCYQNYIDYHKCIAAKGEDFAPCKQFYRAYRSLCPNDWVSRFDEQRENGVFPSSLEP
ncbi:cytochrome c oxidase subunit 6B, partial [Paucibacter sp. DJ4R-1]|nr:cytochrome c oxidase subunit 6B [Paucibacter sp. DJ4R-1]